MVGEEEEYQVSSVEGERNLAESKRRAGRGREKVVEVAWADMTTAVKGRRRREWKGPLSIS